MRFVVLAHVTDGFGHVLTTQCYGPFETYDAAEGWLADAPQKTAGGRPVQYSVTLLRDGEVWK